MFKKKKEVEVVKETRTVKLQGKEVKRLATLNQRTQQLDDSRAKITLEQAKVRGGIEALLGVHAEEDEVVVSYDFNNQEVLLEKEVKPKEEK